VRKNMPRFSALLLLILLFALLQQLLMPKYMSAPVEGAFIREYYGVEGGHDVLFIGDSEVYSNFSPVRLWESYGIPSYVRGSPQQLLWQSYYLLEEMLHREQPQVVILNVLAMRFSEPQREAYNRMTLDGMRLSLNKWKAVQASMLNGEHLAEYLFPLLRYRTRWNDLTAEDFQYLFHRDTVTHNGYYMRTDIRPAQSFPIPRPLPDYQFGDKAYAYLDKITALCKAREISLVLIKAPSLYPHWHAEWDRQIEEYAKRHELLYMNFIPLADDIGLDYETDTYDAGLHLNLAGAEKLTEYLGKLLTAQFALQDRRSDLAYTALWAQKTDFYYHMQSNPSHELEHYGSLERSMTQSP